jgi:general secretion pathway protein J
MKVQKATKYTMPSGLSLIELLVALAVFSVMAALAYGGLNSIARTRAELGRQGDAFRDLMRAVSTLDRDLREAVPRPVLGNVGQSVPALVGTAGGVEFTRVGFANPQAEARSNLERVVYELDDRALKRGRYAVLDRASSSTPELTTLRSAVTDLRLRYLDRSGRWLDAWPPAQASDPNLLPRAVQWRLTTPDYGEIERVIELASAWPKTAAAGTPPGGAPANITPAGGVR